MMGSILITGASSGFGQASARRFAAAGRRLVLAARRMDRINNLVEELSDKTDCLGIELDVRDRKAVSTLVTTLPEPFSDVEVLINNAGLALGLEGGDKVDLDYWDTMVDTNIKGLMYCTRAILPRIVSRGGGHVVNLGSVAASWPYPGGNVYGGTKAFVQQFSRNLRTDLMGKNVRVTCVEPGMCETEFSLVRFEGDERKADAVYEGMKPLSAGDVAEIIFFITSLPSHININQLEVMPVNQTWSPFSVHRDS
ncbi:MAG: NAD(P)-dependent oxidoreductase [Gammaproteobacteria bacterium]|uniref:SDR family NAD(P)-dependent oxidoreductase n=1 Tax=OM182 bacterium TaxID=2510334 RepID=A0A520S4Q3_9GAMM|nr:NAD(P)-dependent oxidoreductase [Gammaproteobacteria bacterium]OUV68282.1 MAG: NAD(P)-dependent oxidoreductase [Gammaproteobacteria bacterium TMED133]RZO77456.1 MAG: SDR family NAD(P)-dependent oxidoreductase [OM182 bacterium]